MTMPQAVRIVPVSAIAPYVLRHDRIRHKVYAAEQTARRAHAASSGTLQLPNGTVRTVHASPLDWPWEQIQREHARLRECVGRFAPALADAWPVLKRGRGQHGGGWYSHDFFERRSRKRVGAVVSLNNVHTAAFVGANVQTLAHELAHHLSTRGFGTLGHDAEFRTCHAALWALIMGDGARALLAAYADAPLPVTDADTLANKNPDVAAFVRHYLQTA